MTCRWIFCGYFLSLVAALLLIGTLSSLSSSSSSSSSWVVNGFVFSAVPNSPRIGNRSGFRDIPAVPVRWRTSSTVRVGNSDTGNDMGGGIGGELKRTVRSKQQQRTGGEKTLYDVLGASPRDTADQLKRRYTTLVRALHPDANVNNGFGRNVGGGGGGGGGPYDYDLSEVNAAWQVLGDPKERLRYDRSLQAKEFTEGVEALMGKGLATAIPLFQKTASTTVRAVDVSARAANRALDLSSRAAQRGAEQAKLAYGVFDLEQQAKTLDQRATMELARARKLERDLETLRQANQRATGHLGTAQPSSSSSYPGSSTLTFAEAQRLIKSFQPIVPAVATTPLPPPPNTASPPNAALSSPSPLWNDLETLRRTELDHREAMMAVQAADRARAALARKLEQAQRVEALAVRRLEEAQRALMEAQADHRLAVQAETNAGVESSNLAAEAGKLETSLAKTKERVRVALLQQQSKYLKEQEAAVRREVMQMEATARELQQRAMELQQQAADLERQQQQNRWKDG